MSVTIIFKIAALGIVVAVLSQILKHSGKGGTGISAEPGRSDNSVVLDRALYQ